MQSPVAMRRSMALISTLLVACTANASGDGPDLEAASDASMMDASVDALSEVSPEVSPGDVATVDDSRPPPPPSPDAPPASDSIAEGPDAPLEAGDAGPSRAALAKKKLVDFFGGISGHQTLAGIHNRHNATPSEFTAQMHDITGKYPAFWSGDFLFESDDIAHRQQMIDQAKVEWSHGAVVQLMFHACPPDVAEPCGWDPGLMHHPLSAAQWSDLTTDGGALNKAWKSRLDLLVPFLRQLQDAGIAPLFRPHHEMNQGAFWWGGRTGPKGTLRLFQITHDYLVGTKGFDNIVWVWDVQDLSWDFDQYDPGESYYDLAALDVYGGDGYTKAKYDAMVKVSPHRPIAIGECQQLPTADLLLAQPRWTFFMGWSELVAANNGADAIKALYTASNVLTLDEMPAH